MKFDGRGLLERFLGGVEVLLVGVSGGMEVCRRVDDHAPHDRQRRGRSRGGCSACGRSLPAVDAVRSAVIPAAMISTAEIALASCARTIERSRRGRWPGGCLSCGSIRDDSGGDDLDRVKDAFPAGGVGCGCFSICDEDRRLWKCDGDLDVCGRIFGRFGLTMGVGRIDRAGMGEVDGARDAPPVEEACQLWMRFDPQRSRWR